MNNCQKQWMELAERVERLEQAVNVHADEVMGVEGVRELTGMSRSAIYQRTCARNGEPPELPHFKRGKRLYFRRSDIVRWMTANPVADREEIARRARALANDLEHNDAQRNAVQSNDTERRNASPNRSRQAR